MMCGVVALRVRMPGPSQRRKRRLARIVSGVIVFSLLPTSIGFQDLGALLANQTAVAERARARLIASPFGTIHAAMFSMPRPVGTVMPPPPVYALANFDPTEITASIGAQPLGDPTAPLQFPTVNRKSKRDSMISRAREPLPPLPPVVSLEPPPPQTDPALSGGKDTGRFEPYSEYDFPEVSGSAATSSAANNADVDIPYADIPPANLAAVAPQIPAKHDDGRIFFGGDPLAPEQEAMEPWAPGEAPVVLAARTSADADVKLSALVPAKPGEISAGESIAKKGQVTGEDKRPRSPAERLGLSGGERAKAEKCLANAVYFESRGEPVKGQIAVAQVVMNRVFSPFYPKTVCGVVYQNAHRHNSCQFTFACDGIPDIVTEPEAWERAKRIARDTLDGKLWMPEVAKSTHYHAFWVHPSWVGEMKKLYSLGVHKFYRPLNWGDGSDEPTWGDAKATEAEAKRL